LLTVERKKSAAASPTKQQSVVERYAKAVPLPDLAVQFDCTIQTISVILTSKEIEMEDEKALKREQMIEASS
jgi:hypothetical protein